MSNASLSAAWMKSRSQVWNQWLQQSAATDRRMSVEDAQRRIERYRAIARDLATARRLLPASNATAALEAIYLSAHANIDVSSRYSREWLLRLFRDEIPVVMHALRPRIMALALLLFIGTFAGWWLISHYPDLISLTASPRMIDDVEHGHLWTEDMWNVTPSSIQSFRILSNNIVVSVFAFCAGIFFGFGSYYVIAVNGLMLGALFAFTHQYGMDGELLKFVLAHGPVELSVMCIAGAAGSALGESLIRPIAPTRRESFQRTARELGRVLLACALLLIVCGFIEGFVSPDPGIPMISRAMIGFGYWFIMLCLLSGRLFRPTRLAGV